MSLIDRIKGFFGGGSAPSALRNKPGGMAWIRLPQSVLSTGVGAHQIQGQAVQCVRFDGLSWHVSPRPTFVAECDFKWNDRGPWFIGDTVKVEALGDSSLEPWRDTGLSETEVAELYAPKTPDKVPEGKPA